MLQCACFPTGSHQGCPHAQLLAEHRTLASVRVQCWSSICNRLCLLRALDLPSVVKLLYKREQQIPSFRQNLFGTPLFRGGKEYFYTKGILPKERGTSDVNLMGWTVVGANLERVFYPKTDAIRTSDGHELGCCKHHIWAAYRIQSLGCQSRILLAEYDTPEIWCRRSLS